MTNAVSNVNNNQLSSQLSEEKYKLVKNTVAKGASDTEFQLLMHVANRYGLDPLLKEIWCIKRDDKSPATIFTSRDGYLAIAHRSGMFAGINSYTIDDEQGNPIKGVCEVWRKDMEKPIKAEAKFKEYNQAYSNVWKKYPSAMIIKVAEVFALKRAFSISGLVTKEELDGGEIDPDAPQPTIEDLANKVQEDLDKQMQDAIERDNVKEGEIVEPETVTEVENTEETKPIDELKKDFFAMIKNLVSSKEEQDKLIVLLGKKYGISKTWDAATYMQVINKLQELKPNDIEDWEKGLKK